MPAVGFSHVEQSGSDRDRMGTRAAVDDESSGKETVDRPTLVRLQNE
jgi:hypothetical protein